MDNFNVYAIKIDQQSSNRGISIIKATKFKGREEPKKIFFY